MDDYPRLKYLRSPAMALPADAKQTDPMGITPKMTSSGATKLVVGRMQIPYQPALAEDQRDVGFSSTIDGKPTL